MKNFDGVSGKGRGFVSSTQRPDWFWDPLSALYCLPGPLSPGYSDRVVKLAILIYRCGRNEWSIPPTPPLVPLLYAQ